MTNKRKAEILDQLIDWIGMHEEEFVQCAVDATDLTDDEKEELGFTTDEEDEEDEEESLYDLERKEYYSNVLNPQVSSLNKH